MAITVTLDSSNRIVIGGTIDGATMGTGWPKTTSVRITPDIIADDAKLKGKIQSALGEAARDATIMGNSAYATAIKPALNSAYANPGTYVGKVRADFQRNAQAAQKRAEQEAARGDARTARDRPATSKDTRREAAEPTVPQLIVLTNRKDAADKLYLRRTEIDGATEQQKKEMTIALFNELSKLEEFKGFAASFSARKGITIQPTSSSTATDIQNANACIRTYLKIYATADISDQLPRMRDAETNPALMTNLIDADTIITAELYLRRWNLTANPQAKLPDESVHAWTLPAAVQEKAPAEKPKTVEATPLQQFARANWENLQASLVGAVQSSNPAAIIKIMDKLPDEYPTLDGALQALNRNDIQLAFAQVFQSLNTDSGFKEFITNLVGREAKYAPLLNSGNLVQLQTGTVVPDANLVRLGSEAVQKYIYSRTIDPNVRADMEKLQGRLGITGNLGTVPENLLLTMSALAVYRWRTTAANRDKMAGEWGRDVGITTTRAVIPSGW